MDQYKTINSFTRKPSPAQVLSYIVITLQTCIFYIMVRPNIENLISKTILTVLFTISLFVSVLSSFLCSYIDPSDSVMIHCKNKQKSKIKFSLSELLFCDCCQTYVTPDARHCRQCNRCVENFDHHCMWINNCVGSKNYKVFIVMISSTLTNLAIFVAGVIVLSIENRWGNFFGFIVTSWVTLAIVFILFVLLFNLNLLHFYLICKGYTTYQFIMARKEEERLQKLKMEKQKQKGKNEKELKVRNLTRESQKRIQDEKNSTNSQHILFQNNSNRSPKKGKKNQQNEREDTNSHINLTNNFKTDLQALHKTEQKSEKSNQKQKVVFGGFEENVQKSEYQSVQIAHETDLKATHNNRKQSEVDNRQQKLESSEENSSIRISQFFIRNKSFNLLISNQKVEKPHKAALEMSLENEIFGEESKTKQNKSCSSHNRPISREAKNKASKSISKD